MGPVMSAKDERCSHRQRKPLAHGITKVAVRSDIGDLRPPDACPVRPQCGPATRMRELCLLQTATDARDMRARVAVCTRTLMTSTWTWFPACWPIVVGVTPCKSKLRTMLTSRNADAHSPVSAHT